MQESADRVHHTKVVKRDIDNLYGKYPSKELVYTYLGYTDRMRNECLPKETRNQISDEIPDAQLRAHTEAIMLENDYLHKKLGGTIREKEESLTTANKVHMKNKLLIDKINRNVLCNEASEDFDDVMERRDFLEKEN